MTPDGLLPAGQNTGPDGDGMPSAEEQFLSDRSATPAEVRSQMRAAMGQDVPRAPRPPDYPGIHQLARYLGLALCPGG
jgi:hypothetical protein